MCDYCGCRSRPLVARLAADHERFTRLADQARTALAAGDSPAARAVLEELAARLRAHDALEEGGIYPELIAEGLASDALAAEHAAIDDAVAAALADSGALAVTGGGADLVAALDRLAAHIVREEYDLFPAAHQMLSDAAWDRIDMHRTDQGSR